MTDPDEKDGPRSGSTTLVVADDKLAQELARGGGTRIVFVRHYLDALGELSRGPVDTVVGRIEPMARTLEPTARALRLLAPDTRLVLVVEPDQEPLAARAVRFGFNDYLVTPLEPRDLLRQVRGEPAASTPLPSPAPTPPTIVPPLDEPPLVGDVSLVDQLMTEGRGVLDRALALARRRLDAPGLRFEPGAMPDPPAAPVESSTQTFGYLADNHLTPEALAPTAAWLARWLALEKQVATLTEQAYRDELTGLWNLRHFRSALGSILEAALRERFRVTLMIYDIDDFKAYNDRFGHPAGDEILRETARLMQAVVRKQDVVARIGGDEFAVIFWDAEPPRKAHSHHPQSVRDIAHRFQKAIETHDFPRLGPQGPGQLTISAGLAGYPWDGQNAEDLIALADRMLRESKGQGKNALTFGPGAQRD